MNEEYLYPRKYDLALLVVGLDSNVDDPYSRWHSDNAEESRTNLLNYSNPGLDVIIEKIRETVDKEEQKKLFYEFQEVLYEDQPCIFLYCPLNKIVVSNRLQASATAKRPGYMANTFTLR